MAIVRNKQKDGDETWKKKIDNNKNRMKTNTDKNENSKRQ